MIKQILGEHFEGVLGSDTRKGLFSLFGTWAAEATQSLLPMLGGPFPPTSFRSTVNNFWRLDKLYLLTYNKGQ